MKKKTYRHLREHDRDRMEALLKSGHEQSEIAHILKVDKSTISLEMVDLSTLRMWAISDCSWPLFKSASIRSRSCSLRCRYVFFFILPAYVRELHFKTELKRIR